MIKYLFIFMFTSTISISQERQIIKGQLLNKDWGLAGVLVININAERETKTDHNGNFNIICRLNDQIIFMKNNRKLHELIISDENLQDETLIIKINYYESMLDEVIIVNENKISAESLNIVPENQKKYTLAERKLYTAGDFKIIHLLNLLGGSLDVDAIINKINGKSKKIKKLIVIEKKNTLFETIKTNFDIEEIIKTHSIPKELLNGFIYYCVEDENLKNTIESGDSIKTEFLLNILAVEYKEIKQ